MAEEVSTTPDNSATIAEKVEKIVENVEKTVEKSEEAAPKKKGRPAGAKDKAPRAKKPRVVVVEEPLEAPVKTQSAGGQTESSQPPSSPCAGWATLGVHGFQGLPGPSALRRDASLEELRASQLEAEKTPSVS